MFVLLAGYWMVAAVLLAAAGLLEVIVYLVAASMAGREAHLLVTGLGVLRPRSPWWRRILLGGALLMAVSAVVAYWNLAPAARSVGTGPMVLAVVSVAGDVARRTIRGQGVTRHMVAALLAGYAWMIAAGAVWAVAGPLPAHRTTTSPSTPFSSVSCCRWSSPTPR